MLSTLVGIGGCTVSSRGHEGRRFPQTPGRFSRNLVRIFPGPGWEQVSVLVPGHLHQQARTSCESEHRVKVAVALAGDVTVFPCGKPGRAGTRVLLPGSRVHSRTGRAEAADIRRFPSIRPMGGRPITNG